MRRNVALCVCAARVAECRLAGVSNAADLTKPGTEEATLDQIKIDIDDNGLGNDGKAPVASATIYDGE